MKQLRFLHVGDIHIDFDPKLFDKAVPSLEQILEYCTNNDVDAVVIPGDIWHRKQSYMLKSGVPYFTDWLRKLSNWVGNVFIVKGNHDDPGSITLLDQLENNIHAYEVPAVLGIGIGGNLCTDLLRDDQSTKMSLDYIVSLVPYPTKASFISEDSIDNNNAEFLEKFENVFELIGDVTEPYSCPKVLGFHGNIVSSRLSSGQTLVSQDIMVSPKTLEKAKHDYYALNHIHLRQEIKHNMIYAGGIANFNWGETEQKSFELVELVDSTDSDSHDIEFLLSTKQIMLTSARPMVTLEATFDPEFGFITKRDEDYLVTNDPVNSEVRYKIEIRENDKLLVTESVIQKFKESLEQDGNIVTIVISIIPDARESRSEAIMHAKSLLEEVEEYAKVVEFEMTDSMKEKVLSLQNEAVEVV